MSQHAAKYQSFCGESLAKTLSVQRNQSIPVCLSRKNTRQLLNEDSSSRPPNGKTTRDATFFLMTQGNKLRCLSKESRGLCRSSRTILVQLTYWIYWTGRSWTSGTTVLAFILMLNQRGGGGGGGACSSCVEKVNLQSPDAASHCPLLHLQRREALKVLASG